MFHRIFDEGLAQSSFVVGCDRTRLAVVVDPRRDVDVYVELARQHGLTLRLRSKRTCTPISCRGRTSWRHAACRTIAGPGAGLGIRHHEARDGEQFRLGDVSHHGAAYSRAYS